MKSLSECLRQVQSLMTRCPSNKQVLVNGLVGVVLGANSLNDRKITELTSEFIEKCLKLL